MHLLRRIFCFSMMGFLFVTASALAARTHQAATARSEVSQQVSKRVNVNTANVAELIELNGIGTKKAQAIVAYREKHGKFNSIEELTAISGIGDKFLARLQQRNSGKIVVN